ncbi:MAG: type II toxin-antitoxin system RelE/ParE family toxin [Dehalococcoidia bacterium]
MTDRPTYTVKFATAVKNDLRKLDKQLRRIIKEEHLARIESDPFKAVPLLYELRGLWSYHFGYKGTQYRIIYEVYPEQRVVLVVMIGSRERLYEALRRRLR